MTYRNLERYWFEVSSIDAIGNAEDGWIYAEKYHIGFIYSTAKTGQVVGRAVTELMRSIHGEGVIPKLKRKDRNRKWMWRLDTNTDIWEMVHVKDGEPIYCVEQVSEHYVRMHRGEITTAEYNQLLQDYL